MDKVLLVEDDLDILQINTIFLTENGFEVISATTISDAYYAVNKFDIKFIILDIALPDGSGIDFCTEVRKDKIMPIIFLSGFTKENVKVNALCAGGDYYLIKPYGLAELLAVINSLLRRLVELKSNDDVDDILIFNSLKIDTTSQRIFINEVEILLSPKEYKLLYILALNVGKIVDIDVMYEEIWHQKSLDSIKTIKVHLSNLRKKLNLNNLDDINIIAIKNQGYMLKYDKFSEVNT